MQVLSSFMTRSQNLAPSLCSLHSLGALLASAIENGVLLEPGAPIPRRLVLDGTGYIMENGVGRDMASNGMVYQFHHVRFSPVASIGRRNTLS